MIPEQAAAAAAQGMSQDQTRLTDPNIQMLAAAAVAVVRPLLG